MFDKIRETLELIGLPKGDLNNIPSSIKRFSDGANFRIEIPTVNSVSAMHTLINESTKLGVKINRITETYGIFRHTESEISEMVSVCADGGCQLLMSVGPRASYDTSATAHSLQGKTVAYRLRGQEQLIRAIADIERAINLGVSSFIIYDEGLLMVLGEMRTLGKLPANTSFKVSAHCGHGNPASFKLLEQLGADSINAVRDLSLPMLASLRQVIDIPIDCHTDNPVASGGFIRTYEAPEIVRVSSPVYLKTGNSVLGAHGSQMSKDDAVKAVRQASIILEMIDRYYPEAIQTGVSEKCVVY